MILERLFGESFIKLGELHRYTFELVDAFVNNAAERAPCGIALGRTDRIYWHEWCVLGPLGGRDAAIDAASTTWLQRRWLAERGGIEPGECASESSDFASVMVLPSRYRIIATEGFQGCRLRCSNSRHSASIFKSCQQSLCARRGRTIAWLHGAPADPCPSAGRKEKSKRTPAMTMDRATSRE